MKKGDMVKYREPVNMEEESERFVVIEDRGDRVLVGSIFTSLVLGATTVLPADDLAVAVPYDEGREAGLRDTGKARPFLAASPYPTGTREREEWDRGYRETSGDSGVGCAGE